jgi:predicted DNA binding protein
MWSAANTKFMQAGDFNKDGYADIAAMYDYGNGDIGIWDFESNGTTLTPRLVFRTGPNMWSAANTKFMVTNDFNKDGYADIAAMYDYGNGKMGIWNFESNGTIMTPRNIYMGANGNWDVFANKLLTAGDHNNDGTDDITAMYDYGNGMVGLWTFVYGNGQLYPRRTLQGYGWSVPSTKFLVSGNFSIDNKNKMAMLYDYGNGVIGIWEYRYKY